MNDVTTQAAARKLPARVAVLLSGSGRTFLNLHDRMRDRTLHGVVVCVVASRHCPGLEAAQERGVPAMVREGEIPGEELAELLAPYRPEWIVLAGYLKKVHIPRGFEGKVVNIHPAILPRHGGKGMHGRKVHEAVLAAGDAYSGCTVHLCDAGYDTGPVVLQRTCPVRPGDTADTLAERVFAEELRAYPEALRMLFDGA